MKLNTSGLYTFENVSFKNVLQPKDTPMVTSYMLYKVGKYTSIYCKRTHLLFGGISRNYKRAVGIP